MECKIENGSLLKSADAAADRAKAEWKPSITAVRTPWKRKKRHGFPDTIHICLFVIGAWENMMALGRVDKTTETERPASPCRCRETGMGVMLPDAETVYWMNMYPKEWDASRDELRKNATKWTMREV